MEQGKRKQLFKAMDEFCANLDNFLEEVPHSSLDQAFIDHLLTAAVCFVVANGDEEKGEELELSIPAGELVSILMELQLYRKKFGLLPDNPGKPATEAIQ